MCTLYLTKLQLKIGLLWIYSIETFEVLNELFLLELFITIKRINYIIKN